MTRLPWVRKKWHKRFAIRCKVLDHRELLSGRKQSLAATLFRGGLHAASFFYRLAIYRRNRRFDRGVNVQRVDVPVISVGNLTTGGTGKTPIVCFLAKWFRQHDIRVAIVSRGYGRGDRDENDEALELHQRLPDVPHVQNADRVAAATMAIEEFESQLILLDDGFQHRRLHRDFDIVVIDATCPMGYGYLLPRGLLREPVASLSRADLIIISRCGHAHANELVEIEKQIRHQQPTVAVVHADHQPTWLLEYPNKQLPLSELVGKRVAAISAIGNPQAFEDSLGRLGVELVSSRRLPDHDEYAPETVASLNEWARGLGTKIDVVVCTHKDLVKLQTDRIGGRPLRAVIIELSIRHGEKELEELLHRICNTVPGS